MRRIGSLVPGAREALFALGLGLGIDDPLARPGRSVDSLELLAAAAAGGAR